MLRTLARGAALGTALGCAWLQAAAADDPLPPPSEPPDVIVIVVDDLGYGDLSYTGATQIQTPNIDALAAAGVVFSAGYATHPLCTGARAGLVTARHPARFAFMANIADPPFDPHYGLPLDEKLFPEYLQSAGYDTAMVGKWHLGSAAAFQPRNRGFDRFFGFLGGGHDYYTSDATSRRTDDSPLTDDDDEVGFEGYLTDVLTDKAIEWVQESRTNPYFLLLAYNAPHGPWQAPAALRQKYSTVASGDRQTYLAMVDSLDTNIGRLVAAVAAGGNRDNTLIFFVSDHGGANSVADHGPFNTGKGSMSEGGSHVPFLACWPGRWAAGTTYAPMVSAMDIGATALAMASVAPGADDASLDGVNLDPFVRGEDDAAPHEALFWRKTLSDKAWTVLRGDMRLGGILQPAPAAWLFNVRTDPGETTNLLAEQRETAQELVDLWNAWNADNESGTTSNGIGVYWSKLEEFQDEYADQLETDADAAGFTIETF